MNYNDSLVDDVPDDTRSQLEHPDREVEVTVSVTLSKTIKVKVNDYDIEKGLDKDGPYCNYDYSDCDLKEAVEEQIILPQKEFSDWNVDEFEVVL